MKKAQIEARVLDLVERVRQKSPLEDRAAELKAQWPADANKAARQLAAMANAARGQEILWVIGLDERDGALGAEGQELSAWFDKVKSEFDGIYPEVDDLVVPLDGDITVVALVFDTSRAPFVVRNPEGGRIQFEVPWREGTGTRTATRSDLLKILVPTSSIPDFEVLSASLVAYRAEGYESMFKFAFSARIYVYPKGREMVVIPFHKTNAKITLPEVFNETELENVKIKPQQRVIAAGGGISPMGYGINPPTESASRTIDSTSSELLIYGPGQFFLNGTIFHSIRERPRLALALLTSLQLATASLSFGFAGTDYSARLTFRLPSTETRHETQDEELARWEM